MEYLLLFNNFSDYPYCVEKGNTENTYHHTWDVYVYTKYDRIIMITCEFEDKSPRFLLAPGWNRGIEIDPNLFIVNERKIRLNCSIDDENRTASNIKILFRQHK